MQQQISYSSFGYPVSSAQKRMFLLEQLHNTQMSYNLPFMIEIEGKIDCLRLQETFQHLIRRHEILRTSFRVEQGEIIQEIVPDIAFELKIIQTAPGELDRLCREFIRPFNLSEAPLFRVELIQFAENQSALLVDMHHSISDGISIQIFNQELVHLYGGNSLSELSYQYRNYVNWENEFSMTAAFHEQEIYWLNKFREIPPPIELPMDFCRPGRQTFNGGMVKRIFSAGEVSRLSQLAFDNRVTLNVLLITAYAILLSKYTGQGEFTIGTAVNGRQQPDLKRLIGLFVNTIPIRITINKGVTISELLKQLGSEIFEANQNQDYPFNRLIEQLNISGDLSRNPLIDTMLIFHNRADQEQVIETDGFKFSVTRMQMNNAIMDLVMDTYYENDGSLEFCWRYNADLFRQESIIRMAGHFEQIIREILAEPRQRFVEMEMITPQEKQRILTDFNDTQAEYPRNKTIGQLFEEQAGRTPQKIAAIFGADQVTYSQLNEKADRLAARFGQKGMNPDDVIGIMLERSLEMLVGILAILKAGGAYLPIDPEFPADRIQYILDDSAAKLLLTKGSIRKGISFEGAVFDLNNPELYYGEYQAPGQANSARQLAYIIYTSGSTGKPKGTMIEHHSVVNRLYWMQKKYPLTPTDVILQKTDFTFDVSVWELFWWSMCGAKVYLLTPGSEKDPGQIVAAIHKNKVTTIHFVPSMLNAFLEFLEEHPEAVDGLSCLRQVFASGEALTLRQVERFNRILRNRYPVKLHNLYGPTEATVDVSYFDCSIAEKLNSVPIGKPIDNIQLFIVNEDQQLQPVGIPGELCIAGAGLARGYLNREDLTKEKFIANPFSPGSRMYRTGDLARWMPDGNIEYIGRMDFQVKIKGFRVELGEIEAGLLQHPSIKEAVVVTKADPYGNKYLCAYFVSEIAPTVSELRSFLGRELPDYMLPAYFVQIDRMPLTSNGKINRRALPEPEGNVNTGIVYVAPRNETEIQLANLWRELLGVEKIGIDDRFFDLGGDSLKAIVLTSKIHKAFNLELPLHQIFENATIRQQVELFPTATVNIYQAIQPITEVEKFPPGCFPLSAAQKRLYILNQFEVSSTSYNMPGATVIDGSLDRQRVESVFQQLLKRHESLRTSFEISDGEPVQRIHPELNFTLVYQEAGTEKIDQIIAGFVRPFDLKKAPLLRVLLVKTADQKHVLIYDMHHIISDGTSMGLLIREFGDLYNGNQLPDLRVHYKDYAVWQNNLMESDRIRAQENYWMQILSGETPFLNLPTDFHRPAVQSFDGDRFCFEIGPELAAALNRYAAKSGTTLYMLLLAAYYIQLSKYSGQEDLTIGSPVARRPHADLERIIGIFINTLALRNHPTGEKKVGDFLLEIKGNTLKAFENPDYPFEELVERLNLERDLSRNPLFDVMFVLQNTDYSKRTIQDLRFEPYRMINHNVKFDLTLQAMETPEGIRCDIEYATRLFQPDTISRFAGHYINILKQIIANPDRILAEIDILTPAEKQQLLVDFNATRADYPQVRNILQLFEEQVNRTPDYIGLISQTTRLSYAELNRKANQLARKLRLMGVKTESIVGIAVERSIEMLVGIFGILKAGGAYLPIDPSYPSERVMYMLNDGGVDLLLTQDRYIDRWPYSGQIISLEDSGLYQGDDSNLELINSAQNAAYVIYTSGSTGKPKGAMIGHYSLVNRLHWMQRKYPITQSDVILQKTSFTFDVSGWEIFWWALQGAGLCLLKPGGEKDPQEICGVIAENRVSTLHFVPSMLNAFLDYLERKNSQADLTVLRQVFTSGEALGVQQVKRFHQIFGGRVGLHNLYGPTEATIDVSFFDCHPEADLNVVPIGKPIDNLKLYIFDHYRMVCPVGVPGELYIAGVGVGRGYLNRPDLTAEKFIPDPYEPEARMYRTGDLARWLPDGNIEFLGRIDHQVKVRGFRVELGEIESLLLQHRNIKEAVAVAKSDQAGTSYLGAYFAGDRQLSATEVREFLARELPDYMIPSYFIQLERLPLNPSGKIDRNALPEPEAMIQNEFEYQAPRNELEEKLVGIWQDVLGLAQIGINHNFFALGGHSLKATIMAGRIYKEFNVEVPLREIFQAPTVKELAEYLQKAHNNIYASILPVPEADHYPASSAQKRLYVIDKLEGTGTSYNMPLFLSIQGEIDRERLAEVFVKLVNRHETLRTSFAMIGDELRQRILRQVDFAIDYQESAEAENEHFIREFIRPFDLGKAPLLRVKLIKNDAEKYLLLCDMHHIISDGTTMGILVREINSLYNGEELPKLRIQYKDFTVWQNQLFERGVIAKQESYWLSKFNDQLPVLNLPTDYPRPLSQDFRGKSLGVKLDLDDSNALKQLALETNATLNMVLLAIYNVLLYRYTGQEDIIVGHGIAGRPHPDLERIVGMFVNTLAIRTQPAADKSFKKYLAEVKETTLTAFENQDYQFEVLVGKIELDRDLTRNPLFDVAFITQNMAIPSFEIKDLEFKPYYGVRNRTSKFDLTLYVIEVEDGIYLTFEYCTGLFKDATIERMAGHYLNIVQNLVNNPYTTIAEIELLASEEKLRLLIDFNNTQADFPVDTIHRLIEVQVDQNSERIALVSGKEQLTYRELDQRANQVARYLVANKVGPEMLVGVMMENSIEQIVAILGVLKAGAGYLPMTPELPEARIGHMIDDARVEMVISSKKYLRLLNRLQWEIPMFKRYLCLDSLVIHHEIETVQSELMNRDLWDHVARTATDEVTGGGWTSSYTGENLSRLEMDEYAENVLLKLWPYLNQQSRVLEIGCASGITMYRVAPFVGLYYGTDLSPEMIAGNRKRVEQEGLSNIKLAALAADQIAQLDETCFDVIIINSVIQCFHGHNYLRNVISKAISLLKEEGILFLGDIMDHDRQRELQQSLLQFKEADIQRKYQTKTDLSTELFVSKRFFEDLQFDLPEIAAVKSAAKIHTIQNELTRYRFDTILEIDKKRSGASPGERHKYQDGLAELQQYGVERVVSRATPDNIAYVIYTSGSTGKPKGVAIEHRGFSNLLYCHRKLFQTDRNWKMSLVSNPSFDAMAFELFAALAFGNQLFIAPTKELLDIHEMEKWLQENGVEFTFQSTLMAEKLLESMEFEHHQLSVKKILTAGDRLRKYPSKKLPFDFYNLYGPTEDTVWTTWFPVDAYETEFPPIGVPILNKKIYILNRNLQLQPIGVPGELCISGVGLARGYLANSELTQTYFGPNPFNPGQRIYRTGDLARWLPDGNIEFLGRIDNQVKIRGFRIELGEIETQLLTDLAIQAAVVIAKDDFNGSKNLYAYLVADKELTVTEIREYLAQRLPDYMIPAYFVQLAKLPLTPSGKVDRKALLQLDTSQQLINTGVEYVSPGTDLEQTIARIWQEVLQHERIGVHDNFFDMGGNSISLIKVHSLMNQRLAPEQVQKISLTTLFQYTTVRSLVQYLNQDAEAVEQAEVKTDQVIEEHKQGLNSFLNIIKERKSE